MDRRCALLAVTVCLGSALASACGSSPSLASQLAPSTTLTVTALSIALNTPSVGGSAPATALATFSNGSTTPVSSGFGSDTPSVATVTSAGQVTGVAIGDVTIFVDFQGQRASKKVHVLPSYNGLFTGTYAVGTCVGTGDFTNSDPAQNFCTEFTAGRVLSIAVQNAQSSDLTTLTGLFALGGAQGSGIGTISSTGTLTYTGAVVGGTTRMDFRNWTATSPTPGRITGAFDMVWTDSTLTGSATITCTNMDMTRQGSAASLPILSLPVSNPGLRWLVLGTVPRR
jgi:hypothetical protein